MARVPNVPCAVCGTMMWSGRGSLPPGEAKCRPCRSEAVKAGRPCVDCGATKPGRAKKRCPKCSIDHYAKSAASCSVRKCDRPALARGMCSTHYAWYWRALRGEGTNGKGTWIMPQRRLSIYERDGWVCGICGTPVDVDADTGADMAPSLDHIVPRSCGGGHESENLRTAHRVCNSRRGASMEEVSDGGRVAAVRDNCRSAQASAEPGEVWAAV